MEEKPANSRNESKAASENGQKAGGDLSEPTSSHNGELPNLEELRLSQDFADTVGVKKEILTVPVRKPDRQSFVRVHPDESYRTGLPILSPHFRLSNSPWSRVTISPPSPHNASCSPMRG